MGAGDVTYSSGVASNAQTFTADGALLNTPNLTFALNSHFRSSSRRILFAFNVAVAETGQVKTLPLF
jgi:hypothetical protein